MFSVNTFCFVVEKKYLFYVLIRYSPLYPFLFKELFQSSHVLSSLNISNLGMHWILLSQRNRESAFRQCGQFLSFWLEIERTKSNIDVRRVSSEFIILYSIKIKVLEKLQLQNHTCQFLTPVHKGSWALSLTESSFIPAGIHNHIPNKMVMKLHIHSQTSAAAPLKFGNGQVISFSTL